MPIMELLTGIPMPGTGYGLKDPPMYGGLEPIIAGGRGIVIGIGGGMPL